MNTQRIPTLGPCHCKRGQQRDNCPACEGTGQRINFPLLRLQTATRANLAKPGAKWTPGTGWTDEPTNN